MAASWIFCMNIWVKALRSVPDGSHVFWQPFRSHFGWKRVRSCWLLYSATPDNVLSRIITDDETWIHHWDPETKQESMQWKHVNSPPPRKFRTQNRLESHGHNFLGLQRPAAGGLHTTEDNNDWTQIRWSADKSASGSEGEAEGNSDPRSAVAAR